MRTRFQAYQGPVPTTSLIGSRCPECRHGRLQPEDADLLQCDNCGWWKQAEPAPHRVRRGGDWDAPCPACYWGEPRGTTHSCFCAKYDRGRS